MRCRRLAALGALLVLAGCARDLGDPDAIAGRLQDPVRFAVIGDYGNGSVPEGDVAKLVEAWRPEFVVTTGDNNYPAGAADTIDDNVGKDWSSFIAPYHGRYGTGAATNAFFPVLGNHDWGTPGALPYLEYFTLPGNGRYYDVVKGVVHVVAADSDPREPDGVEAGSTQERWLCDTLRASGARWKLVFLHHPPWSSGHHGPFPVVQWPFQACGAHAVFAGHDHDYERIQRDGIVYFVNGLGGQEPYPFHRVPVVGSRARFDGEFGAQLVEADARTLLIRFYTRRGDLIDWVALGEDAGEPP
ncbi:metallophosphoesterase [Anaeromyxobacter oryzae]|uniref:Calcineurin-like phosphoesterase domain-containing protein n=1 Tax=Anaeromyxobacter oryzae TaxID=2918170 RepID=A0ABM7X068_9BACT|nr:metallophosphoesterase [Anaeromyxobacter oryzae]BDG05132.1 hypothetical protein AMOR_41280 [Anaeromyxobacter oryzae]